MKIAALSIWKNPFRTEIALISVILMLLSIVYEFVSIYGVVIEINIGALLFHKIGTKEIRLGDYIIYAGLVILPPLYFLIEYLHLIPDELKVDSKQFDDLKYMHELAGKV